MFATFKSSFSNSSNADAEAVKSAFHGHRSRSGREPTVAPMDAEALMQCSLPEDEPAFRKREGEAALTSISDAFGWLIRSNAEVGPTFELSNDRHTNGDET